MKWVAAALLLLSACAHAPASYPDQIAAWHAEKDRFMRESAESPVPADKRATFPPLSYFPTDPSYRTPASLQPAPSGPPIECRPLRGSAGACGESAHSGLR